MNNVGIGTANPRIKLTLSSVSLEAKTRKLKGTWAVENSKSDESRPEIKTCQYAVLPDGVFQPTSTTVGTVPAGIYQADENNGQIVMQRKDQNIGDLIVFEDSMTDVIINEFNKFWLLRDKYEEMGEIHKRGYLLHGPPGGGKTSLIEIIKSKFVAEGNLVIEFNHYTMGLMQLIKSIEPDRKVMVTIEDIDAWTKGSNESVILNFLDGDQDFNNIVVLATTNYIEQLPDRIVNRPSRFDRVEFVGFPTAEERKVYLEKKSKFINGEMPVWVETTENWTFAHIKELLLATEVYEIPFEDTVARINKMRRKEESSSDYTKQLRGDKEGGFGFGG